MLVVSGGLVLAIGVRLLAGRLGIPTAGLLLVAAAVASDLIDRLSTVLSFEDVQRIATLALVVIWTMMLWRSDNGCTGVSSAYARTMMLSALLLFGFGPIVVSDQLCAAQFGPRSDPRP